MFHHLFGNKSIRGISLIEMLVSISVIAVTLTSLLGLASFSLKITILIRQTSQANYISQEIMEQIRNIRNETSWSADGIGTLVMGADYYVQKTGSPWQWQLIQGTETVNGFTKKAIFENVMRDGTDNIVESGGADDPNTKKVTATVSWEERGRSHSIELITYLTNWRE